MNEIYVLGGEQTDFAENWTREGHDIGQLMRSCLMSAFNKVPLNPKDIDVVHVSNALGGLFCQQVHLGALVAEVFPAFQNCPISRHEAAGASGGLAILAAMADLRAGHYDTACVIGAELMRNVVGETANQFLKTTTWSGEAFDRNKPVQLQVAQRIFEEYQQRFGIATHHVHALADINNRNAHNNANAQSRNQVFDGAGFSDDDAANPKVTENLRATDCSHYTDGAACLILANKNGAEEYAKRNGLSLENIPRIKGWGHRTERLTLMGKLMDSSQELLIFPHVRQTIDDALGRASFSSIFDLDGMEIHDTTAIAAYMLIDHLGLCSAGESWIPIEEGMIRRGGSFPLNPSGGLLGGGHPLGATGIRMVLDCWKQVTQQATDYQIKDARNFGALNMDATVSTITAFIVGV